MIEVLPIRLLRKEDAQIFGSLNVSLSSLHHVGLPVSPGVVITPPMLILQTTISRFHLGHKELFQQSLLLVKKEVEKIPIPDTLVREIKDKEGFFIQGNLVKSTKGVWLTLLGIWLEEVTLKLMREGFSPDLTSGLQPVFVSFVKDISAYGKAYFDEHLKDIVIKVEKGTIDPVESKKIDDLVTKAGKKLLFPFEYNWIADGSIKMVGLENYSPQEPIIAKKPIHEVIQSKEKQTATKVFFDLSCPSSLDHKLEGAFIAGESGSLEDLTLKVTGMAENMPHSPILFKLADIPENIGGVRGTLRLLHQTSLFESMCHILQFARHKKNLTNVHLVIPFVRSVNEFTEIKRALAAKKLVRKLSFQFWMEVAVPENILNMEEYLEAGVDGILLNLDELTSHLYGFNHRQENMVFYQKQVKGLIKFLEGGMKVLHKNRVPMVAYGKIVLDATILEFLVENGVRGVIVESYEAHSIKDLLHQVERKVVLKRSNTK